MSDSAPNRSRRLVSCVYCRMSRDPGLRPDRSPCLCDGTFCAHCGIGRVRRPGQRFYDPRTRSYDYRTVTAGIYVPCEHCAPLVDHRSARPILQTIKQAGRALSAASATPHAEIPAGAIVSLHGDAEVWRRLDLGPVPDGRPLYVGHDAELHTGGVPVRVGIWRPAPGDPADAVLHLLLLRWRPPLNGEVPTPWNDWQAV